MLTPVPPPLTLMPVPAPWMLMPVPLSIVLPAFVPVLLFEAP
jgi:hypothetical protein